MAKIHPPTEWTLTVELEPGDVTRPDASRRFIPSPRSATLTTDDGRVVELNGDDLDALAALRDDPPRLRAAVDALIRERGTVCVYENRLVGAKPPIRRTYTVCRDAPSP